MKLMKFKISGMTALLAGVLLMAGCQKEQPQTVTYKTMNGAYTEADINYVSIDATRLIAERLSDAYMDNDATDLTTRNIMSAYSIADDGAAPALHVFNYEDGGFAVLAADYRYEPIVAYVPEGSLEQGDDIPSMMDEWFGFTIEQIGNIRDTLIADTADIPLCYHRWNGLLQELNIYDNFITVKEYVPENQINCGAEVLETYPGIMLTKWGQADGYNDLVNSSLTCSSTGNLKPPVGCVATAVGMLLKYWHVSNSSYDYSLMPTTYGTTETQKLMRDLGASTHLDITYNCDGSGTNSNKVKGTLENKFYFNSGGTYRSYNMNDRWVIKTEIQSGRPVYVDGCASLQRILFFNRYGSCHAWLVDGYKLVGNTCRKHFWYRMNWGWEGRLNGWYYEPNWTANASNNYQYSKGIIYDIHP